MPDNPRLGWTRFDENRLVPLAPQQALDYFTALTPGLETDPERFRQHHERQGFTLAATTERTLLAKVQEAIRDRLATGEDIAGAPAEVEAVLEGAGVGPLRPGYGENVVRTALMDSYTTGTSRELADPGVQRHFPAFLYSNPGDSRSGDDHKPHHGKIFPASVPFAEVRNWYVVRGGKVVHDETGQGRPWRCRCVPVPLWRRDVEKRLVAGSQIESWPPAE